MPHHAEFLTFADEVTAFATGCRSQLPDVAGFPESEAAGIAKSVATWTWAVFVQGNERQRNDANRLTAPARRPALGEAGYRGDPALNADRRELPEPSGRIRNREMLADGESPRCQAKRLICRASRNPMPTNALGSLLEDMLTRSRVRSENTRVIAGPPGLRPDILVAAPRMAPPL